MLTYLVKSFKSGLKNIINIQI